MDQVRGQSGVLAALAIVLLVLVSCTSTKVHEGTSPAADFALSPAPRACPIGVSLMRETQVKNHAEVIHRLSGHVPTWFPPGFGLSGAWTGSTWTQALWSDQRCRSVSVYFYRDRHGLGSWSVDYDKPHACGNYVMGMGECIGYSAGVGDGAIHVQTIGLTRSDADHLVHSIKV